MLPNDILELLEERRIISANRRLYDYYLSVGVK